MKVCTSTAVRVLLRLPTMCLRLVKVLAVLLAVLLLLQSVPTVLLRRMLKAVCTLGLSLLRIPCIRCRKSVTPLWTDLGMLMVESVVPVVALLMRVSVGSVSPLILGAEVGVIVGVVVDVRSGLPRVRPLVNALFRDRLFAGGA